jgi:hypothetical protein
MQVTTIESFNSPYGQIHTPIHTVISDNDDTGRRIVFLGGMGQNPDLMLGLQNVLAGVHGISSVGLSAFDTVGATEKVNEGRMQRRANILNYLGKTILREKFPSPTAILTHCAGANVLLLAQTQTDKTQTDKSDYFPIVGVLAEPMLEKFERLSGLSRPFAAHEYRARKDPKLISLLSLSAKSANNLSATDLVAPLQEIIDTDSAGHFVKLQKLGAYYMVVVGINDFAARRDGIEEGVKAAGGEAHIVGYSNQELSGHGFLLVNPGEALNAVVPLLHLPG